MKLIIRDDIKRVVMLDNDYNEIKCSHRSYKVDNHRIKINSKLFKKFEECILESFISREFDTYRVFNIISNGNEIILVVDKINHTIDYYTDSNVETFNYWPSDKVIDNLPLKYSNYMVTDFSDWQINKDIFEAMGIDSIEFAGMTGEIPRY
ncbi:hypothetical protein JQN46_14460 [Enterobacter hormaechei]|uniref:hypothetical protein n=1 Tax=Enterobacter hormaechei TaxID=158836 RepID=UPI001939C000|nr:hypothetical protein [Enterobacter hormaechei]MBM0988079.1 hypothetical protein [Enterobacter hormaechei]